MPDSPGPLEPSSLIDIAAAVIDGLPVDWAKVRQSAPDKAVIDELEVLARIAACNASAAAGFERVNSSDAATAGWRGAPAQPTPTPASAAPAAPVSGIWGDLLVLDHVASGSFGSVYRAWDPNLEREVALKLLNRSHTLEDQDRRTLLREGQLLARVKHPNVMQIYGAREIALEVGLWGEFVRGETLAEIVDGGGVLSAVEASAIGDALCEALGAVHAAGLVHRDVKAQNVMRATGGRIVLMDFGLGYDQRQVDGHALAGTPLYLAPELFEGAPASPATDIYSCGVLLFYLVSGRFPIDERQLDALKRAHQAGDRLNLHDLRPDLPAPFVRVVETALAPDPKLRYQSAGALRRDLAIATAPAGLVTSLHDPATAVDAAAARLAPAEGVLRGVAAPPQGLWAAHASPASRAGTKRLLPWFFAAAVLCALIAVGIVMLIRRAPSTPPSVAVATAPSVALVGLRTATGDVTDMRISEMLTDEIGRELWRVGGIRIINVGANVQAASAGIGARDLGQRAGAGRILHGIVGWTADRVRVLVTLVSSETGETVWSDAFERDRSDLASLQRDIASRVAAVLKGEPAPPDASALAPAPAATAGTSDPTATSAPVGASQRLLEADVVDTQTYTLYLKGRLELSRRTPASIQMAVQTFSEAVRRRPRYALAHAGLADAYNWLWGQSVTLPDSPDVPTLARRAADAALSLDSRLPDVHCALGLAKWAQLDYRGAEAAFRRGLQLNALHPVSHQRYALYLATRRRFAEALDEMRTAQRLDPLNLAAQSGIGWILFLARRYDDAIEHYRATLTLQPGLWSAHRALAELYALQGRRDDALEQARRAVDASKSNPEVVATLARIQALTGDSQAALGTLSTLLPSDRQPPVAAGSVAAVYAALGRPDDAFTWLERSLKMREIWITHLLVDPRFDPLRGDPRFRSLLQRAGFR